MNWIIVDETPDRYVLDIPRIKSIIHDHSDEKKRLVLLKEPSIGTYVPFMNSDLFRTQIRYASRGRPLLY